MASCYSTWRLTKKHTRVTPLPEEPGDSRMRTSTQLKLGGSGKRQQKKKTKKSSTHVEKSCVERFEHNTDNYLHCVIYVKRVLFVIGFTTKKERLLKKKKKTRIGHLFCHTLALWGYFVWLYASWDNCDWEVFNDTHLSAYLLEFQSLCDQLCHTFYFLWMWILLLKWCVSTQEIPENNYLKTIPVEGKRKFWHMIILRDNTQIFFYRRRGKERDGLNNSSLPSPEQWAQINNPFTNWHHVSCTSTISRP